LKNIFTVKKTELKTRWAFTLIELLPANAHSIAWKLSGVAPNTYSCTGSYTNSFPLTVPPVFDQVGFMGGAALFNSASTADSISFKNLTVTLAKHWDAQ
jgi:hypothetical protein